MKTTIAGPGPRKAERGVALISVLLVLALLMALLTGYFGLTMIEQTTTRSSMDSFRGFYAAEAGLNVRAEIVRQTFSGYAQPGGTPPTDSPAPCTGTNLGSGDFACVTYDFQDREVPTYVKETVAAHAIRIPRGETYQNLNAEEHKYVVYSEALGRHDSHEAVLEMHFKSRLVPLFQFAAFYDKDLEFINGPDRLLNGPIHTNGDLYLGSTDGLGLLGQITASGDIYRGRKDVGTCMSGDVSATDPDDLSTLPACSGTRRKYTAGELGPWNGMVQAGIDSLTVPPAGMLEPSPGKPYWANADVRIVLNVTGATPVVEARRPDGTKDGDHTAALTACGSVGASSTFYNHREATPIKMLEIDVRDLLDCIHTASQFSTLSLDDATGGGLILYLGVEGPDSATVNNYGVRLHNGAELSSTDITAPAIRGLTVATEQALYVQGNYNDNSTLKQRPAALLADSINVLSNNWPVADHPSGVVLASRPASATVINSALLAGTDNTGGFDGPAGKDLGQFNGGLENFVRFHEDWTGTTLTFRGSLVSLFEPRHVDGPWAIGGMLFQPPILDWDFDFTLNDPSLQPPLTPRFIYLRQELFVRRFDL